MNTIHCGVVFGDVVQSIQEINDAINVLTSSGDNYGYVKTILRVKMDEIWNRCVVSRIHEYPAEAYKAFVDSEIKKENA